MSVRDGLLALLASGEKHGYQLKVEFDQATGNAWPLNIGQVYTTLQRLERDGLVEAISESEADRRTYRATAAGREATLIWLTQPVPQAAAVRDEISLKVLLTVAGVQIDVQTVLDVQRADTMTAIQDLTLLKKDADPNDLPWLLHLDRQILLAEAELRWLARAEERLTKRRTHASTTVRRTQAMPDKGSE